MGNNALQSGAELQNGKYRIVNMLGQGGFGITYQAEQVLLHRGVAIKEFFMKDCCERDISTSHVSVGTGSQRELVSKFREKFLREAQMIAGLDNPHIVKIHDVFEENGTAYYIMENLPGGSLTDKVKKEGPLSEAQAEKYIRQVADALAYIHERNTVHLDVKPSNILLNAKDEAVLIDFGISKHYDKAGEQTSSTPVGISKGYAPLEQGRDGDVSQFKPSTDIYALGATLYHLVNGQVPPEASIVVEEGLDRPQGVSDRIWNVISKAMQPKRKDRPQSIAEFLQLFDKTPVQEKEDADETEVITKKKPAKELKVDKHDDAKKKSSKSWLWLVLGVVAVAAIVLAVILGKKRPADDVLPATPGKDTIETVVTPEPAKPEAKAIIVTGIKLSKTSVELHEGESATLKATVSPADATDKTVTWKSYDEQVASVSKAGKVTAKKVGTTTIVARCGNQESICNVTVVQKLDVVQQQTQTSVSSKTGSDNGHEWVDLGLPSGTKWATCNVGASSPSGNGNYYAWGEINTKSYFLWTNYRFRTSGDIYASVRLNKYNTDSDVGKVDNMKQLDISDDAARANWGGRWHVPTKVQWEELDDKCTWLWTRSGYKVTGPNGKSITIPAAGDCYGTSTNYVGTCGNYWSSSLCADFPREAWFLFFDSEKHHVRGHYRYYGRSIRPVTE